MKLKIAATGVIYVAAVVLTAVWTKNFYITVAVYSGGFVLAAAYAERVSKHASRREGGSQ